MSSTYKIFLEKIGNSSAEDYIGRIGDIFFDPDVSPLALRLSDGSTPGGALLSGGGSSGTVIVDEQDFGEDDFYAVKASDNGKLIVVGGSLTTYVRVRSEIDYPVGFCISVLALGNGAIFDVSEVEEALLVGTETTTVLPGVPVNSVATLLRAGDTMGGQSWSATGPNLYDAD